MARRARMLSVLWIAAVACGAGTADGSGPELWPEEMGQPERSQIEAALAGEGVRLEGAWARVRPADIDGDGVTDYVVAGTRDMDGEPRRVLGVLRLRPGADPPGADWAGHAPEEAPISQRRMLYAFDADADGLQDLVDQRFDHMGGGEAEYSALVLRFDGRTLTPAYRGSAHAPVRFEDVDGDGRPELIESRDDLGGLGPEAPWITIYHWQQGMLVEAPLASFRSFYRSQADRYREIVEEVKADASERKGKLGFVDRQTVRILSGYLARIDGELAAPAGDDGSGGG